MTSSLEVGDESSNKGNLGRVGRVECKGHGRPGHRRVEEARVSADLLKLGDGSKVGLSLVEGISDIFGTKEVRIQSMLGVGQLQPHD